MKSIQSRACEMLAFAKETAKASENWITLNNALYGPGGKFSELFTARDERAAFFETPEGKEVTEIITRMRNDKGDPPPVASLAFR